MSLAVWLPLNGSLENQGLTNIQATGTNFIFNNYGKIGQCLELDQTLNLNVPQSLYDVYSVTGTEISYSLWFKLDKTYLNNLISNTDFSTKTQIYNKIIGFPTGTTSNGIGIHLRTDDNLTQATVLNQIYIYSHLRNGSANGGSPVTLINLDEWYHLVITYSQENELKFYINGVLIDSRIVARANINSSITNKDIKLNIAACQLGNTAANAVHLFQLKEYFNDVRIYDHCLSQKEVEEISKGLVLHYKLDNNGLGNPNFLTNSSLKSKIENFPSVSNQYIQTFEKIDGYDCFHIHSDTFGINSSLGWHVYSIINSYPIGTQFTFSGWIKTANIQKGTTNYFSQLYYGGSYNNNGTSTWIGEGHRVASNPSSNSAFDLSGQGWTYCYIVSTFTRNDYTGMNAMYYLRDFKGDIYLRDFKFEIGDNPTPWVPSLSELQINNNIIYDSSGYGNHGTIVNTLSNITFGTPRYDIGTWFSKSPYVKVVPFNFEQDKWTVSFWYYKTAQPSAYEGIICLSKGNGADANKKFAAMPNNGYIWFKCESGSGRINSLKLNEWVNIVFNSIGEVYENGVKKTTLTPGTLMTDCTDLVIGARASAAGVSSITTLYEGGINDVRIYSTVLTENQIKELYNTSSTIDNLGNVYAREVME